MVLEEARLEGHLFGEEQTASDSTGSAEGPDFLID